VAAVRQTNFLAGELAPSYWGRTDLKYYGAGVRTGLNFIISPQGSAMTRPGTRYVALTNSYSPDTTRLLPYVYSDTVSYVLELEGLFDQIIAHKFDVSTGVDVATVIATGAGDWNVMASEIQYAQVGAVLVLAHPTKKPKQLYFNGATWTYGDVDWTYPALVWRSIPLGNQDTGAPFIVENILGTFTPTGGTAAVNTAPFTATATEPLVDWVYAVTAVIKDTATGALVETRPYEVINKANGIGGAAAAFTAHARIAVSKTKPVYLMRYAPAGAVVSAPNIITYNYYKGRAGLFGFIGASTDTQFVDDGREPDYNLRPLKASTPTGYPWSLDGAGGSLDYPASVAFHENRRVWAGGSKRPGTIIASASGDWSNLDDYGPPAWHGEPLIFDVASKKRERLRTLASHYQLLAFTDTSVWAIGGGAGAVLDYDTFAARLVDEVGSRSIQPLTIGGQVLFARSKGSGARMLTADFNSPSGGYRVSDATEHAIHLFGPISLDRAGVPFTRQIKEWCYQEDPFGLIWAIRNDGVAVAGQLTGNLIGWTRVVSSDFESASVFVGFTSICSVPEGAEDAVYALVGRYNSLGALLRYSIERFESRIIKGTTADVACLDCAVKKTVVAGALTIAGLPYQDGAQVWISARANAARGPFTVTAGAIDISDPLVVGGSYLPNANNGANVDVFVGYKYDCDLETLDPVSTDTRMKQRTVVKVGFEVDSTVGVHVGPDSTHLVPAVGGTGPGSDSGPYDATADSQVVAWSHVLGTWDTHGRAFLRVQLPLPVTVTGLTRELDVGG
jgi:hypothetical protein